MPVMQIATHQLNRLDIEFIYKVLTEPNIHSYLEKGIRWYVFKDSEFIYIHYSVKHLKTGMLINYRPSYQVEVVDIPTNEAKKQLR